MDDEENMKMMVREKFNKHIKLIRDMSQNKKKYKKKTYGVSDEVLDALESVNEICRITESDEANEEGLLNQEIVKLGETFILKLLSKDSTFFSDIIKVIKKSESKRANIRLINIMCNLKNAGLKDTEIITKASGVCVSGKERERYKKALQRLKKTKGTE